MTTDQQFCLRWNNFHTNITSAFESLRDDEDFVDITLACEGRQIKAHKMVLSACSPYFRNLLRGNPCQHPIVFLKDVTFANLTSILDFMYHGEVNVSHNELATFLKTAEALRVRGLAEDEKKRDRDTCTKSSSPPPPRDLPEPCSPGRPDEPLGEGGGRVSAGPPENSSHSDGPPMKRQRRQSGGTSGTTAGSTAAISPRSSTEQQHSTPTPANTSTDLTTQQQLDNVRDCVKNEPEDYINEDEEILGPQSQQQTQQQLASEDIKLDGFSGSQDDSTSDYMGNESVSISSRSQAAMQQLQETFSSFIPGMSSQNPGGSFMPHSTAGGDHGRGHPPFSLEGVVQGLPPGISALPGPSMSQSGGASQDSSGQGLEWTTSTMGNYTGTGNALGRKESYSCPHCNKSYTARCNLSRHIRDQHSVADPNSVVCPLCGKNCRNRSNALTHLYRTHHITSKQLRTEAGALFNAPNTLNNTQSNNANLGDLSPSDLDALVHSVENQEPPTFSFEGEGESVAEAVT
uniref:Broad-complex core protein isoforms 1/2/3/4/5-like n=1 Tax=Hirondellea gigas TaxID=1518452 RepID=A0A2P2HY22_9CRUS